MVRIALAVVFAAPAIAAAQTAPADPVEHRLSPDQIAAAQADGAEHNRAAELLALTRGEPSLALPGEKSRKWHGSAEIGIGSNGYREIGGEVSTQLGDHATATIAGQYGTYTSPFRGRVPNR